jgi:hypothetical protein
MTTYDIYFSGALMPGIDPSVARARIQGLFKLSDEMAGRLFSGRTVAIKRGLDFARAERLRQVFLEVGALVQLVERSPEAVPMGKHADLPLVMPAARAASNPDWALAARDGRPLELDPGHRPPRVDISCMRLIPGQDWSLADCDRGPEPVVVPDVRHLRILALEPMAGRAEREERG